jgi:NTE family protein
MQGGGARGAFQVGAYAAAVEEGYSGTVFSGISIGALNSAILAGNKPEDRVAKLRSFWRAISDRSAAPAGGADFTWLTAMNPWLQLAKPYLKGEPNFFGVPVPMWKDAFYFWHHAMGVGSAVCFGQPNFFEPRKVPPFLAQQGTEEATSWYSTKPLRQTLLDHVDFDLINAKSSPVRLFLGAVKVKSGKMVWFDNEKTKITPEHVMASGALPPGFPGIRIDGDLYWDGGCHTNTAIDVILKNIRGVPLHVFMPILFSTEGDEPRNLAEVELRRKNIQYGSHSTYIVEQMRENIHLRQTLHRVLDEVTDLDVRARHVINGLFEEGRTHSRTITTVEYETPGFEGPLNDADFDDESLKRREEEGYKAMKRKIAELANCKKRTEPNITL